MKKAIVAQIDEIWCRTVQAKSWWNLSFLSHLMWLIVELKLHSNCNWRKMRKKHRVEHPPQAIWNSFDCLFVCFVQSWCWQFAKFVPDIMKDPIHTDECQGVCLIVTKGCDNQDKCSKRTTVKATKMASHKQLGLSSMQMLRAKKSTMACHSFGLFHSILHHLTLLIAALMWLFSLIWEEWLVTLIFEGCLNTEAQRLFHNLGKLWNSHFWHFAISWMGMNDQQGELFSSNQSPVSPPNTFSRNRCCGFFVFAF